MCWRREASPEGFFKSCRGLTRTNTQSRSYMNCFSLGFQYYVQTLVSVVNAGDKHP